MASSGPKLRLGVACQSATPPYPMIPSELVLMAFSVASTVYESLFLAVVLCDTPGSQSVPEGDRQFASGWLGSGRMSDRTGDRHREGHRAFVTDDHAVPAARLADDHRGRRRSQVFDQPVRSTRAHDFLFDGTHNRNARARCQLRLGRRCDEGRQRPLGVD